MYFIKYFIILLFFNFSYGEEKSSISLNQNEIFQDTQQPGLSDSGLNPQGAENSLKIQTENEDLEKQLGDRFQTEDLTKEKITDFLLKQGYFNSRVVKTIKGFHIQDPYQIIFILKGNHFFNDYKIKKLMKANSANQGKGFEEALLSSLKAAYHSEGFQKILIKKKQISKGWKKWVYLTFNEGPRIKIAAINLKGFISKPSRFYVDFIKSNSSPLIRKGYFNKKDLEIGYKNLILFLKKNGYLQSKIYSDRIIYKNNKAYITVNMDEGPLTLVKSITFEGNQSFSHAVLSGLIESRIFEPLRLEVLEKDILALEEFYKHKGYLQVKILNKESIVSYSGDKRSYTDIHIVIGEGVQSRISAIFIKGAVKMKESFIRKLLKFKTNEILNLKKIRASRNVLNSLGVFSRVSIDFDEKAEKTVVTVSLTEKKSRAVRMGAGMNTERGLTARAYTEFTHRNLFGQGRNLFGKVSGQLNFIEKRLVSEYELSAVYQEIFFPGQNIKGNVGLSRERNIFNYTEENINGVRKNKIRFFVETHLSEKIRVSWTAWDLEGRREFCIYRTNCSVNFQSIGSTGLMFAYDKRDNIFNPSRGLLFSLSGEYASALLGSSPDIQFSKINAQSQFYFPFSENYTLAAELRSGMLFSARTIPVSRAFILGGQTTIRGYDGHIKGERIPNSRDVHIERANESLKLGGSSSVTSSQYGLVKLELRFPFFKSVKGLVFYDGGGVYLNAGRSKNSLLALGHAVGFGFRYEGFLIPIGLDFGYKLPPKEGNDYRFHFAIGLF